jgi:hypothetical protein
METEGTVEGTREESRRDIVIRAYLDGLLKLYYASAGSEVYGYAIELLVQVWDCKMPEDTTDISCFYFLVRAEKIVKGT